MRLKAQHLEGKWQSKLAFRRQPRHRGHIMDQDKANGGKNLAAEGTDRGGYEEQRSWGQVEQEKQKTGNKEAAAVVGENTGRNEMGHGPGHKGNTTTYRLCLFHI